MLKSDRGRLPSWLTPTGWVDPVVAQHVARVTVWGRWLSAVVVVFDLAHRPAGWYPEDIAYLYLMAPWAILNGLVHHRLLTKRPVTWRWLLLLSAMDTVVITGHVVVGGGFESSSFLGYYPAVAAFAVVFSPFWLVLTWAAITSVTYVVVSLTVDPGLDLAAGGDLRGLVDRVATICVLAVGLSLVLRFERTTRQAAAERERRLQQERIELSQAIHDTTAQTAYMIGLGIHRARELAGESNEELTASLDATSHLSKSAMWELRRPIDAGLIFEGRELGSVLWSHCATFEKITGVTARMSQSGTEPPLAMEKRSRLFSIAHNALTNAFLHARPGRVEVRLDFEADGIRLSVSDDGVGLPGDYGERGRGFRGMRADAERMGGTLMVESGEGGVGTTITCVVPKRGDEGGG